MSDDVRHHDSASQPRHGGAHALAAFWHLLRAERRTIARITAATVVLATAYAFIMPHTYSSTVSIFPPKKEERGLGLADMLSGGAMEMFDLGATLGFGGRPSDMFVKILSSRTVSDSIILRHHMQEFFGISESQSWRLAATPLKDATTIDPTKDGMITVTVSLSTSHFPSDAEIDSVKRKAADIANDYVRFLDIVNREKLVSSAKNSRLFIEEQLKRTTGDLATAYSDLVAYQEKNRALMVDKQLDALVATAGALKLQLTEASTELGIARRDLRSESRTVRELESTVEELQKQYDRLSAGGSDKDFVLAFGKLPKVARDLSLLVRRVKILEEVNAYLNKQYYKERVQEARDLPTVQVLDRAIPAWQRTAPKRAQWALMSLVLGLVGSVGFVVARETRRTLRARRDETRTRGT